MVKITLKLVLMVQRYVEQCMAVHRGRYASSRIKAICCLQTSETRKSLGNFVDWPDGSCRSELEDVANSDLRNGSHPEEESDKGR
jgi:hypothetical protein